MKAAMSNQSSPNKNGVEIEQAPVLLPPPPTMPQPNPLPSVLLPPPPLPSVVLPPPPSVVLPPHAMPMPQMSPARTLIPNPIINSSQMCHSPQVPHALVPPPRPCIPVTHAYPHVIYLNTALPPPGYIRPVLPYYSIPPPVIPHVSSPKISTSSPKTSSPSLSKPQSKQEPKSKKKIETGRNVYVPKNEKKLQTKFKLDHPLLSNKGMSPKKRRKQKLSKANNMHWEDSRDRAPIPRRSRDRSPSPYNRDGRRDDSYNRQRHRRYNSRDRDYDDRRSNSRYSSGRQRHSPDDFARRRPSSYLRDNVTPPRRPASPMNRDIPKSMYSPTTETKRRKMDQMKSSDRVALVESDFEDVGRSDLSDTDEEVMMGRQGMPKSRFWAQSTPAGFYYRQEGPCKVGTERSSDQRSKFHSQVLSKIRDAKKTQAKLEPQDVSIFDVNHGNCGCCGGGGSTDSFSSSSSSIDSDDTKESEGLDKKKTKRSKSKNEESNQRFEKALEQLERKQNHPSRLHSELWFNEPGMMNDGPLCRCSWKAKQTGIRHSIFPGEKMIPLCVANSNNLDRLHHYIVQISPMRNLFSIMPSSIQHDDHEYQFAGFSLFTHYLLPQKLPVCRVMRWNIEYTLQIIKEDPPDAFTVCELEQFWEYFFDDLLEMYDICRWPNGINEGCPSVHIMPRFTRPLQDKGREVLSMAHVLAYLLNESQSLVTPDPSTPHQLNSDEWNNLVKNRKGQIVYNPNKRPCSIRVDQMDWRGNEPANKDSPVIIHFGVRPSVITYAGNPDYQKAWKQFVKYRHLMLMKGNLNSDDKQKLEMKEGQLYTIKAQARIKRDVTVEVSCEGFSATGLYSDIVMQGMMMLVMINHIRFHTALDDFEEKRLKYKFRNRALLESRVLTQKIPGSEERPKHDDVLAFSHPSYRTNYGTNPDHARNTLSNCGIRQPVYASKRYNHCNMRKRGINTLLDIMSKMGSKKIKESTVRNNERLEYLGDAVIEFLSTIHLFYMFPDLEEGGLATYRSALVQNKHLAVLAKKLDMDSFMLYAHGPDLCHEADLKHAMANAFEAVMGALFLDAGLEQVDRVYGEALFPPENEYAQHYVWTHLHKHPLQEQEENGDRHWIRSAQSLQKLTEFENRTGIEFIHIRLLARAFTRRNVGYNLLTLGHNQRLEFLGDTVLQLITSEYLYKHFPEHHEGHLSLLRSCLVNNKTQSVICDDLGMVNYVIIPPNKSMSELRMKDKADLVESFIGALYVDRGLEFCKTFCKVCFYPRLKYFILSQRWNDPKSQLQQCCLTLRNAEGGEPDIPVYKVIAVEGPTNTRVYKVAVYFKGKRMADAGGHSVQEAEMRAAEMALNRSAHIFPNFNNRRQKKRMAGRQMEARARDLLASPNKNAGLKIKGKYLHMRAKNYYRSPAKRRHNR